MGLDQWAKAVKGQPKQDDLGYWSYDDSVCLGEWRKHSSLHGWMENLFRSKGGEGDFNCVAVDLDAVDLENLKESVQGNDLPATQGFFFGNGNDERYKEQDLTFVDEALDLLDAGYKIQYTAWW
ncbi:MAG: phosphoglycerate kinase [Planctomycetaceae bacterium]|nr:phosphoglycerate kinase [Bacteroides sp.]MCP4097808.1 phosphoglycerate kinase [Planctomycetaceae bacterium]MCP4778646.1 phosphoglycerate kinase [Planctomycetaceae bacterium]